MTKIKIPKANKILGQHYLIDDKVINNITSNHSKKASLILEIGPGPATLTRSIILNNPNISCKVIEKDTRFKSILSGVLEEKNIIYGDALSFNFDSLNLPEQTWLISNLPYNISAPLSIKTFQIPNIKYMTLMYQKEVGDKILGISKKSKNNMSSLYVLAQTFFECQLVENVSRHSFDPPPQVESIVVSFVRKENPKIQLTQFKNFEKFLRLFFKHKRKQIKKVLNMFFNPSDVEEALIKNHKTGQERAESFTLQEVCSMYFSLKK